MEQADLSLDTLDVVSNETFAANGYPHEEWAYLRREAPVFYYERNVKQPFWAITKHEDIVKLSRQSNEYLNGPRLAVFPEFSPPQEDEREIRHLLVMDAPDHPKYRKLTSAQFTPRSVRRLEASVEQITRETLDGLANGGEPNEIDFVNSVSAPIPLAVLAKLLGVPREDWKLMFDWTNAIVGSSDPEYQQGGGVRLSAEASRRQLFAYFWKMTEERRKKPRDDIASVLANAEIDGAQLPPRELLSYFFLLVVAGNETTRNAMSGGLLALIQNPDQFDKLRKDPTLVDSAVEEVLRWTTPVIQFCRTATADFKLRDKTIRTGDNMCLFYPSANRDEEVFEDPFEFRIDRQSNRHLAFGIGGHFCLGANLARLELRVLFRQLAERMQEAELTGDVERLASSFLGGVKHMPIRHLITPASSSS